jgi:hypothetical protein
MIPTSGAIALVVLPLIAEEWKLLVFYLTMLPVDLENCLGLRCLTPLSAMGKQLVNFITCGCESSAPFFVIYKVGCEPTQYW